MSDYQVNEIKMIAQKVLDTKERIVFLSSAEDYTGKTTVARALCASLLNDYSLQVNYLDLNLRHPTEPSEFENIKHSDFQYKSLPDSYNDFSAKKKKLLLSSRLLLKDDDSILIVECSPVNIYNQFNIHPTALLPYSKNMFLVVNTESTRASEFLEAKKTLISNGFEIAGVILNRYKTLKAKDNASLTNWLAIRENLYSLLKKAFEKIKQYGMKNG